MNRTKVSQIDHVEVVALPPEVAYGRPGLELMVSRQGDIVTLQPVRRRLMDVVAELRRLPKPTEIEKRAPIELPDREGL